MVRCCIALAIAICVATMAIGQAFPEKSTTRVTDNADLLTAAQEAQISGVLTDSHTHRGAELNVVTLSLVGNYFRDTTVSRYAKLLFEEWNTCDGLNNNGVLFLLSQHDRELRIELGQGYGREHEVALQKIVDQIIVPAFHLGNYDRGIQQGVNDIIRVINRTNPAKSKAPERLIGSAPLSFICSRSSGSGASGSW